MENENKMVFGKSASSSKSMNIMGNGDVIGARTKLGSLTLKSKFTALIVDDDIVIQMVHKKLLNNFGIENVAVGNGKEAVDLYLSGAIFDLILMDNEMPVMDGPEATRVLRAMGVRSKIVGVTTHSEDLEKREFMDSGLDDFHEKPLPTLKLVSILRELDDSR